MVHKDLSVIPVLLEHKDRLVILGIPVQLAVPPIQAPLDIQEGQDQLDTLV